MAGFLTPTAVLLRIQRTYSLIKHFFFFLSFIYLKRSYAAIKQNPPVISYRKMKRSRRYVLVPHFRLHVGLLLFFSTVFLNFPNLWSFIFFTITLQTTVYLPPPSCVIKIVFFLCACLRLLIIMNDKCQNKRWSNTAIYWTESELKRDI